MRRIIEFRKFTGETDIRNLSNWHKSKRHFSFVCLSFTIVLFLSLIGISKGQTFDWAGKITPNESAPAIDKSGNVYMIGSSLLCPGCGGEMIITKFNSLGERLWRKRIAGKYNSITEGNGVIASGIALFSETSIYIAGNFIDTVDFDPGSGVTKLIGPGSFIAKYDTDGNFLIAKKIQDITLGGFDVDNSGNLFLTGSFSGTKDFNPDAGTYYLTSSGESDIFIAKYSPSWNFIWAKKIGGNLSDHGEEISIDPTGNIIISGKIKGEVDFSGNGQYTVVANESNYSKFLARYNNSGNFVWVNAYYPDLTYRYYQDLAAFSVDDSGNVFALINNSYNGDYIIKYVPTGYSTWLIGFQGGFHGSSLAIDGDRNLYITGSYDKTPPIMLWKIDLKVNKHVWGRYIGDEEPSGNNDYESGGHKLSTDSYNNIYLTGILNGPNGGDLNPGYGDYIFKGGVFLARYSQESTLTPFITTQSEWKYLDNATNQGTIWRNTSFNDAAWPSGIAPLGNNGFENTQIGSGYLPKTTYFRKNIYILDKSVFTGFNIALLRDDGAVVYVNGVEVWRSNMPTGTISYSTYASTGVNPPAESQFINTIKTIPVSAFVNGDNVIAVEVHQASSNSDLSFNLKLWGVEGVPSCSASGTILGEYWSGITGKEVSLIPVTTAPTSTSMLTKFEGPVDAADNYGARIRGYICPPFTGYYTFWIASDDKSELWLSSNDNPLNKVKIASVNEYTSSRQWTKYASQKSSSLFLTAGKKYYIEALHKEGLLQDNIAVGWQLPDGLLERPIPGSRLSPSADPNVFNFISSNASWKYLDNGTNQGTLWRYTPFNDAAWKTGNAELGYGDGDEATIVSYGSNAANKYITTYFRKSFSVSDKTAISSLDLNLIRDDGAVVYLNGIEVFRSNMPTGTIAYTSLASSSVGSPQESSYYTKNISTTNLVNGTNVIAVEIHQATAGSADLSFKFKLTGRPNLIVLKDLNDSIAEEIPITESAYDLSVFPNPNTGTFTIEINTETETTEAIQIKIYDLTGRMLRDQIGNIIDGRLSETINIENLNSGIYLVEVMIKDMLLSKKIILEK